MMDDYGYVITVVIDRPDNMATWGHLEIVPDIVVG